MIEFTCALCLMLTRYHVALALNEDVLSYVRIVSNTWKILVCLGFETKLSRRCTSHRTWFKVSENISLESWLISGLLRHATAEIERLRAKVKSMSKRIHHLEEALAAAHATSSSIGPHPLLNSPMPDGDAETPDGSCDPAVSDNEAVQVKKEEDTTILDSSIMYSFSELAITDCKSPTDDGVDASTVWFLISASSALLLIIENRSYLTYAD